MIKSYEATYDNRQNAWLSDLNLSIRRNSKRTLSRRHRLSRIQNAIRAARQSRRQNHDHLQQQNHPHRHTPKGLRIHSQRQTRPRMDHGTLSTHQRQR